MDWPRVWGRSARASPSHTSQHPAPSASPAMPIHEHAFITIAHKAGHDRSSQANAIPVRFGAGALAPSVRPRAPLRGMVLESAALCALIL